MASEIMFFLIVLIVALILGNALLSITKPKSQNDSNGLQNPANGLQKKTSQIQRAGFSNVSKNANGFPFAGNPDFSGGVPVLGQLDGLSRRVDRVENLLLKLGNSDEVSMKMAELRFSQKVSELADFRQNAMLEIESLNERMDLIDSKNQAVSGKNSFQENPKDDESEFREKIHQIIYNSKK